MNITFVPSFVHLHTSYCKYTADAGLTLKLSSLNERIDLILSKRQQSMKGETAMILLFSFVTLCLYKMENE
jgi:hypothetical protein